MLETKGLKYKNAHHRNNSCHPERSEASGKQPLVMLSEAFVKQPLVMLSEAFVKKPLVMLSEAFVKKPLVMLSAAKHPLLSFPLTPTPAPYP